MATQPGGSVTSRAASETRTAVPGGSNGPHHDSAAVTGAKFRHGLLQLMIHTIDPMHDGIQMTFYYSSYLYLNSNSIQFAGRVDEKATQLHAIASLKVLLDATKPQRGTATSTAANNVKINFKETTFDRPNGNIDTTLDSVRQNF